MLKYKVPIGEILEKAIANLIELAYSKKRDATCDFNGHPIIAHYIDTNTSPENLENYAKTLYRMYFDERRQIGKKYLKEKQALRDEKIAAASVIIKNWDTDKELEIFPAKDCELIVIRRPIKRA